MACRAPKRLPVNVSRRQATLSGQLQSFHTLYPQPRSSITPLPFLRRDEGKQISVDYVIYAFAVVAASVSTRPISPLTFTW